MNYLDFLDRMRQFDPILIEGISIGYRTIFEAVSINKEYLIKQAGGIEQFQKARTKVDSEWNSNQMDTFIKNKAKLVPFLYLQEIRKPGSVDKTVMEFLHDLSSAGKLNTLDKLNSDTGSDQFSEFVRQGIKALKNLGELTDDEEEIYLRVKVFHDFGDGFQWVVALDENGEVSGYMPSCVSQKTSSHCGNEPSVQDGDEYFELRKNNKPYLTVIINDGEIQESKSFGNRKNAETEKVLPYLKWLFKHEHITGVGRRYDYGYSPDTNMGIKDFLGIDDEFVEETEKKKPGLLGKTEKKIIEIKRKLDSGKITIDDVMSEFMKGNIQLYELRGILGKIPFTDDQIVELVKKGVLDSDDILRTDIKLLTYPVQHAFSDMGNSEFLLQLHTDNPTLDIDLDNIVDGRSAELTTAVKSADVDKVKSILKDSKFSKTELGHQLSYINSTVKYANRTDKTELIKKLDVVTDILLDNLGTPRDYDSMIIARRILEDAAYSGNMYLLKALFARYPEISMDYALSYAVNGFDAFSHGANAEILKFIVDTGKCTEAGLKIAYYKLADPNGSDNMQQMADYVRSKTSMDKAK